MEDNSILESYKFIFLGIGVFFLFLLTFFYKMRTNNSSAISSEEEVAVVSEISDIIKVKNEPVVSDENKITNKSQETALVNYDAVKVAAIIAAIQHRNFTCNDYNSLTPVKVAVIIAAIVHHIKLKG